MKKKPDFRAAFEEQRAAGVDLTDPMNNLIAKPGQQKPKPKRKREVPADNLKGFVPEATGKRTKRVQLVMTPELFERVKSAADNAGISFNEFVNQLCNKVTQ